MPSHITYAQDRNLKAIKIKTSSLTEITTMCQNWDCSISQSKMVEISNEKKILSLHMTKMKGEIH